MAWHTSNRRTRLPDDWETVRRPHVLKRDGFRCQWIREDTGRRCGAFANQVDHKTRGDDHSYRNLQSLCAHHHAIKSSREGAEAAAERRKTARRRNHPGIIR